MPIGILGGTFDPVHNGHISIAQSFLYSGYINELWVLLTPAPPHKPDQLLTDYDLRLGMLKAAFEGQNNTRVCDLERRFEQPSYTVQTLEYLNRRYPDKTFYLCIGEDSVINFKAWHRWKDILAYTDLLVARRPSTDAVEMDADLAMQVHFVPHKPIEISSTSLRNRAVRGEDISTMVPSSVAEIIREHQLYSKKKDDE